MEEKVQSVSNGIGTIKITDEVVAIAGIAAMEVRGDIHERRHSRRYRRGPGQKTCQKALRSRLGKKPQSTCLSSWSTVTGYLKWRGRYRRE